MRVLALLILLLALNEPAESLAQALSLEGTVVLADPGDPYYALAKEIAQKEGLPILHTLDAVLAQTPAFALWVISPAGLSDQVLVDFGLALRNQPSVPSIGIISGSTLQRARVLWQRGSEVKGNRVFAANAANPQGHIEAGILAFDGEETATQQLTLGNLVQVMGDADYMTFTGHGGASYLRLDDSTKLRSDAIPPLPPVVVATGSCNTFRPWEDGSIALAFIDRGAAAYAGYVFSPNAGYLMGAYDGVPFRYTWPEFPIGHVVQVQNHGAMQGFAHFPFHWLLGDPRISLQEKAAYHLVADEASGTWRTLTYADAPAGMIPVRIPDGAQYHFAEIPGSGAAWDHDPFYNARLQMVNIQNDKYVLFQHPGGDFTLRLRSRPTVIWVAADVLTDALDDMLLFLQEGGGDIIFTIMGILTLVPVAVLLMREKVSSGTLIPAALVGLGFAVLHSLYALARLDRLTVTSKTVVFHPLGLVATFLLVSCGAFLFLNAESWRGRVVAVLVATLNALITAMFYSGLLFMANNLAPRATLGTGLWNLNPSAQAVVVLAFECALFGLAFWVVSKIVKSDKKETIHT